MKKLLLFVILIFGLLVVPSSCKKGEDDPFISFRTRKARLEAEWICNSLKGKYSELSSSGNYYANFNYSGNTLTVVDSDSPNYPYSLNYSLKLKFSKDGKFTATEIMDSELGYLEGTWNFVGRVGEDRNKESIIIKITSSTNAIDGSLFALNGNTITYRIKELRNKKLVLVTDSYVYTDGTDNEKLDGEYVFESK